MITPTIGRVVLYRPLKTDGVVFAPPGLEGPTHAALITHVWGDRCVNLAIFDSNGAPYSKTSVALVQDGDAEPYSGHCQWMPFQRGQASKTDELAAVLAKTTGGTQ